MRVVEWNAGLKPSAYIDCVSSVDSVIAARDWLQSAMIELKRNTRGENACGDVGVC